MSHNQPLIPSPHLESGWAIWHRNKAIIVPDKVIAQIRASPTNHLGDFEGELGTMWKNLFPITPSSVRIGNLDLNHPAWGKTLKPWWKFLTDTPLITEVEARELNRLRRPLVTPHLDESGWLVQERKVIDFRGSVTAHMGNFPMMKLCQILNPITKCDLLVCCKEEIQGILKYMVLWKPNGVAFMNLLRSLGWSMMKNAMMGSNHIKISNDFCTQMNILLWNCRGVLNVDFKRRIYEMAISHFPSIMVVTETRVGGERAARII